VGAGISGCTAAYHLKNEGYIVQILEARNRIGGRIFTNRERSYPIDLGASWMHGNKQNPLEPLLKQFGAKSKETDYENVLILNGDSELTPEVIFNSYQKFQALLDKIKAETENSIKDQNLRDHLDLYYKKEILDDFDKRLFLYFERGIENEMGAELSKLSSYGIFHTGEKIEGADELIFSGLDMILIGLLKDININLNQKVIAVRQSIDGVNIETQNNVYSADFVIITVPVPILQKNHIIFDPPLPLEKSNSISKIPFGFYSKYIIEFPEKFWTEEDAYVQLKGMKNQWYELLINLEPYTNKPVLGFLSSGERAKSVESDKNFLPKAISELKKIFDVNIPTPLKTFQTDWSIDPYSLGAFTYPNRDMDSLVKEYSKPFGKVFFAGEGTHEKYFSYLHGAYLSGIREAERILNL
ncbi:MAG: FAD-dependent oxidoreductase, partial [Spirochaetia bacterium]|nr:FAD-dependent oxidoreductase [Spirochaetia bacterium]